jgi:hypothetical protein
MFCPRKIGRILLSTAFALALVMLSGAFYPAQAQSKLEAEYTISMARIPVGKGAWTTELGLDQYAAVATGSASGILSILISGEGAISTRGVVKDGRLQPAFFMSKTDSDDDKSDLRMRFEDGNVIELVAQAPPLIQDRVPVTEAHRQGVMDPLSALLIPISGTGGVVSAEACQRALPVFDGLRRYDLTLAFKRMDKVKADKGYQGPAVVCSLAFRPIAGHRASSTLVKYLSQGRDMELWLAPIAGTRVLAPFRLSITNLVGNIVINASRFQATAQATAKVP